VPSSKEKAAREPTLMVLDLPKLALNRVLEEVSPASLSAMACFCARLRLVPLV
jgi:hypothetical protein